MTDFGQSSSIKGNGSQFQFWLSNVCIIYMHSLEQHSEVKIGGVFEVLLSKNHEISLDGKEPGKFNHKKHFLIDHQERTI